LAGITPGLAAWLGIIGLLAACSSPRDNSGYITLTPTISAAQQAAAVATAEQIQRQLDQATFVTAEVDGNGPGIPYIPGPLLPTGSGLRYFDQQVGEGPTPEAGDTAIVNYTGWLLNGLKFDSSLDRGTPAQIDMGASQVIKGFEEGLTTMRPGGNRRLVIPPELAYGPNASSPIPPNATLLFDVELVSIRPKA
jgi:peptidylprolyl isomerase